MVSVQFLGRAPTMEGFDGIIGWTSKPRRKAGGYLDLRREFGDFPPGLKFADDYTKVQVDAMEKIGDRDVYSRRGHECRWHKTRSSLF